VPSGFCSLRPRPTALAPRLSADERAAHLAFVATLGDKPIWRDYLGRGEQSAHLQEEMVPAPIPPATGLPTENRAV